MSVWKVEMTTLSIIGCGFVADLYMRSLRTFPDVQVAAVYDRNADRAAAFASHWGVKTVTSEAELYSGMKPPGLVLNLTNPDAHFEVNKAVLDAGHHVYSEKPLAMKMDEAQALYDLAGSKGLLIASAPCSVLGEASQMLGKALRQDIGGRPRLIYAELDDGFIPQAPHQDWISPSGAPWPSEDEFRTGCTVEHAGYYLSWLIAHFGAVERVVAASGRTIPDLLPEGSAADTSVATLFFKDGLMARLTCSIVGPHDHRLRIIGDKGVLCVKEAWKNSAPVTFFKRVQMRRRLIDLPVGRRIKPKGKTHPKVERWGAAEMNFALGPVEMLQAIRDKRSCRLSADFALHLNEVTLAIQNAGRDGVARDMTTSCEPMEPMPWAL